MNALAAVEHRRKPVDRSLELEAYKPTGGRGHLIRMKTTKGKAIAAGMIGNVLEWYDFAIYGYFAASIGRHFFPREDPVAQLLAAFGVFALGYLVRPIGGALIGHIGDRYGRRNALTVSIAAMAIPTFLMGLLPGYETLGLLAPIALILLRMIQGLSVGGEYTSSMVFMVEQAPVGRRGLMGALTGCGTTLGILAGSGVGAATAAAMSTEALDAWGWRVPFLLGILVGIAGFFLRRHVTDDAKAVHTEKSPFVETMRHHWRLVAWLAAISVFNAVSFYVMFVYVASWLQTADGISPAHALEINTASMFILLPVLVLSGWLSDRFGRRPILLISVIAALVVAVPLFWMMYHPSPALILHGTNGLRHPDRTLLRCAGSGDGRSRTGGDSLYGGRARLQCVPRGVWRTYTACGHVAGGPHRRPACTRLSDDGRGGDLARRRLAHEGDLPHATRLTDAWLA